MDTKVEYQDQVLRLMLKKDGIHDEALKAAYYLEEDGDYLVKNYYGTFNNVDKLTKNFMTLMPEAFDRGDWEAALLMIAKVCKENHIVWYLTGSACDVVRGIDIVPHDLDIEIASSSWEKAKAIFQQWMVEPFHDTNGWVRKYFGRVVLHQTLVDMVADERFDLLNHAYEPYEWKGYTLWLEPFIERYKTEKMRQRQDRIRAFETFLSERGIVL